MSSTNETREVYNALQHMNLQENERWSDMRSDVDEWCRYESQSGEENEVSDLLYASIPFTKTF
jgi:hypothetical protein